MTLDDSTVYVVTTFDEDNDMRDQEVLDGKPTWGGQDLPRGWRQIVRVAGVNGGDSSYVRTIWGPSLTRVGRRA